MEAPVRNYDPRDVSITIDGLIITGLADGSFVTCEKLEETYVPHVGSQGEVVRARNANPMGKIVFTCDHTSPSNGHMVALANTGKIFPGKVVDLNPDSNRSAGGSECWVEKVADFERAGETTTVEWTVMVADYEIL